MGHMVHVYVHVHWTCTMCHACIAIRTFEHLSVPEARVHSAHCAHCVPVLVYVLEYTMYYTYHTILVPVLEWYVHVYIYSYGLE